MQDSRKGIFLFQEQQQCIDGNDVHAQEGNIFGIVEGISKNSGTDNEEKRSQQADFPILEYLLSHQEKDENGKCKKRKS